MSTVKISDLVAISVINSNTANTLLVGVDVPTGVTGKLTAHTLAQGLYSNEILNVGNNQISLPNTIAQFSLGSDSYIQTNLLNTNDGGSADYVITANSGSDTTYFIDMGYANKNFVPGSETNSLGTALNRLDGYIYTQGSTSNVWGGNLIVGTVSTSKEIRFIAGGGTSNDVVAKMSASDLTLNRNVVFADGTSQNTSSGSAGTAANAAFAKANSAGQYANSAFTAANSAGAFANSAADSASSALINAGVADTKAIVSGRYANGAFLQANAAFIVANTPPAIANSAAVYANAAFLQANTPSYVANSAASYANSAFLQANAAFLVANAASVIKVFANSSQLTANTATGTGNILLGLANTAVTAATYGGASVVPVITIDQYGRVTSASNVNSSGGGSSSGYLANSIIFSNTTGYLSNTSNLQFLSSNNFLFINGSISTPTFTSDAVTGTLANTSIRSGNYTWLFDNTGKVTLPNLMQFVDGTTQNTAYTGSAATYANGAFIQANAAFIVANTPPAIANSAAVYANAAFLQANTPSYVANSAASYANSAFLQANAAFLVANAASVIKVFANSSQLTANTSTGTGNILLGLANTAVTAATYGGASVVPVITIDQYGRITAAANVNSSGGGGSSSGYLANAAIYSNSTGYLSNTSSFQFLSSNNFLYVAGNVSANIVSSNSVIGASANTNIQSGLYSWNFDNTGKTTLPNLLQFVDGTTQNTAYTGSAATYANGAFIQANAAFIQANTATSAGNYANGAFTAANNAARVFANSSQLTANTSTGTGNILLGLANTAVTPTTYGGAGGTLNITVDQYGRITAAANVTASGGGGVTLTNDTTTAANTYYPLMAYNATSGTLSTANTSSTKFYYNPSTGTLNATIFNSISDETSKTDIQKIVNALSKISALGGYTYMLIDGNEPSAGLIAQEVQKVLPEAVRYNSDTGLLSLNYNAVLGLVVESINELEQRVTRLENGG